MFIPASCRSQYFGLLLISLCHVLLFQVPIRVRHVGSRSKGHQCGIPTKVGGEGSLQVGCSNWWLCLNAVLLPIPSLSQLLTVSPLRFLYRTYVEDYNTGTLPHKKYYDLDLYERKRALKAAKKGKTVVCAILVVHWSLSCVLIMSPHMVARP